VFLFEGFLPFSYYSYDLGKNTDFAEWYEKGKSVSVCFCVATIEVCVFRALASVDALFILRRKNYESSQMRNVQQF
jgi:hypothetical protein